MNSIIVYVNNVHGCLLLHARLAMLQKELHTEVRWWKGVTNDKHSGRAPKIIAGLLP